MEYILKVTFPTLRVGLELGWVEGWVVMWVNGRMYGKNLLEGDWGMVLWVIRWWKKLKKHNMMYVNYSCGVFLLLLMLFPAAFLNITKNVQFL